MDSFLGGKMGKRQVDPNFLLREANGKKRLNQAENSATAAAYTRDKISATTRKGETK